MLERFSVAYWCIAVVLGSGATIAPAQGLAQDPAPFDATRDRTAAEASAAQQAWAQALQVNVESQNSLGMKFRLLPPGQFIMGAAESDDQARERDKPSHKVRLSKAIYVGQHEVTVGQFQAFCQATRYQCECERDGKDTAGISGGQLERRKTFSPFEWGHRDQTANHPIVNVTWNDAQEFCKWLSEKESKSYRLLTEAEWEYACRAGGTTRFAHGDEATSFSGRENIGDALLSKKMPRFNEQCADWEDGFPFSSPVGKFPANAFGLFDMAGNAHEWCADWLGNDYYLNSPEVDPPGPETGKVRVMRGGSWYSGPASCYSACRSAGLPSGRLFSVGFRVACTSVEK